VEDTKDWLKVEWSYDDDGYSICPSCFESMIWGIEIALEIIHLIVSISHTYERGMKMSKPMQGNKKERRQARRKRRIVSVSRFKKASRM